MSTQPAGTFDSLVPHDGIELREGYVDVGDVTLHDVEAGEGPLVVLLQGFPQFWFGWRLQIAPLVAAGVDKLADDIGGLIRALGAESAMLVGHDRGGSIAWTTGTSSGTSRTTRNRPPRRRRWSVTSRRGRSRGRRPG